MLFGGLESIVTHNQNRKRKNLKFYEFGTTYIALGNSKFEETKNAWPFGLQEINLKNRGNKTPALLISFGL